MNKPKDFFDKLGDFFNDLESIKNLLPSIHKAGIPFVIIFIIITIVLSIFSDFLGWIGVILSIWCVYFFRDPDRFTPLRDDIIVSPADGKIISISEVKPPETLAVDKNKQMTKISIFMNVFNVHVNRIPITGKVTWMKYVPGTFFNASLDKASEDNERMITKLEVKKDIFVYVVQIAGLIARRIKCELEENQKVTMGNRFGIIRFGSRVDLYLPLNYEVSVLLNQTTIAGETILAHTEKQTKAKNNR